VTSGAPASAQKIEMPWQKAWVLGLVPPDTIQSKERCPQGIAQFETKHSFLNGLVSGITYSIFTPIHPTVTCASGPIARVARERSKGRSREPRGVRVQRPM
jgi:hypothetical protein